MLDNQDFIEPSAVLPERENRMKAMNIIPGYSRLSTPEKIIKLEELWDDIAENRAEDAPVPQSHQAELTLRHTRYAQHPDSVLTLKELQSRVGYK